VIAANGIPAFLFDALRPTPELSFAIRHLHAMAGINMTASHNPKEYNGYKVYWEDGAQLPPEHSKMVSGRMEAIGVFSPDIRQISFEEGIARGLIYLIGGKVDEAFLCCVLAEAVDPDAVLSCADSFKVVYTPFHGSGYRLVPEVLRRLGMKHILIVRRRARPTELSHVKFSKPGDKEGFAEAIALAKKEDVALSSAPDPTRTGWGS
jgi:phosphoglucomutase